jgi:hypothetical protein
MNVSEIEYVLPFAIRYAVIASSDLTRKVRPNMLESAFRVFAKWCAPRLNSQTKKMKDPASIRRKLVHFLAEPMDLIRYRNSVVFLYAVITHVDGLALNRIGTHPVENYFRTIRLGSSFDHSWIRFLSAAAKGVLSGEIMAASGLESHSRRDFSIGGVKVFSQSQDTDKRDIPSLLEYGIDFLNFLDGHSLGDEATFLQP